MTPNSLDPEIRLAVEAAQDKQALDISVLNLQGSGAFADYFLLCSGSSQPQIQAIGEAIEDKLGRQGRHVAHRDDPTTPHLQVRQPGAYAAARQDSPMAAQPIRERLQKAAPRPDIKPEESPQKPATSRRSFRSLF